MEQVALTQAGGYCWAYNAYLAELFGLSIKTVEALIKQLRDRGHIQVEVERDPETQEVLRRKSGSADRLRLLYPLPTKTMVQLSWLVEGRLQLRDYTDRDGNKRRAAEVVADQVYFVDSKKPAASEGNAAEGSLPTSPVGEYADLNEDDGELPF